MKSSNLYKSITALFLLGSLLGYSQKKDENIGTEVVNVVKPYTATISDAFKVKETPSLNDDEITKKENVQYNIFSFPVASTFTPAKGKAAAVDKAKRDKLYSNYATLGFGNYGTILGELFVTENISSTDYIGGMFRHHSSQGGIKEVALDDSFYNTALDLTYGSQQRDYNWNLDLGYQNQVYNCCRHACVVHCPAAASWRPHPEVPRPSRLRRNRANAVFQACGRTPLWSSCSRNCSNSAG